MQIRCVIMSIFLLLASPVFGVVVVNISNLQPFSFDTVTVPFNTLEQTKLVCLYNSDKTPNLSVNMTGANDSGNNFYLANGSSQILYQVEMTDAGDNNFLLFHPSVAAIRIGQNKNPICGNPTNRYVSLRITLPASSFMGPLSAGNYGDTLTIMISPG